MTYPELLAFFDAHPTLYAGVRRIGPDVNFVVLCTPGWNPLPDVKLLYSIEESHGDAESLAHSTNKFILERRRNLAAKKATS